MNSGLTPSRSLLDNPNRVICRDQLLRSHRHHQRRLLLSFSSHPFKVQPGHRHVN